MALKNQEDYERLLAEAEQQYPELLPRLRSAATDAVCFIGVTGDDAVERVEYLLLREKFINADSRSLASAATHFAEILKTA